MLSHKLYLCVYLISEYIVCVTVCEPQAQQSVPVLGLLGIKIKKEMKLRVAVVFQIQVQTKILVDGQKDLFSAAIEE